MKTINKDLSLEFSPEFLAFLYKCYEGDHDWKTNSKLTQEQVHALVNPILIAFQKVYELGATTISFTVYGEGDSGEDSSVEIFNDNKKQLFFSDDIDEILSDFGWSATDFCNPGYEVNDGGGWRATATINEKKLSFQYSTYVNVHTENELSNHTFNFT